MTTSRRTFLETTASVGGFGALASLGALTGTRIHLPSAPSSRALKVLILGGTGFIGPYQVAAAQQRGHQLTLFNRGRSNLFPNVETLLGDRDGKLDALKGRKWDVVIDNSGFYPRHVRDSAEILKDAADRYLFVSSISVYDRSLKGGQDEYDAPIATMPNPADETDPPYGATYGPRKALCEQELVRIFGKDRAISVRPGLITGPGDPTDRVRHWVRRAAAGGEIMVPGSVDRPMQLIDARDLSEWIVRLLETRPSGFFNAVGPSSSLTAAEFMGAARAVSSSNPTFTFVADDFLEPAVRGTYSYPVGIPGMPFMQVTNRRALAAGLTFRPLATTLTDMLPELKTGEEPPARGSRMGPPPAKEAEILGAWRARR